MFILLVIPLFGCLSLFFIVSILKRKWIISLILSLLILALNVYAEIISFGGLFQSRVTMPVFTILTYNVQNNSTNYKIKQAAMAAEILSVSPDVAFLCEFDLWRNRLLDSIMTINNGYVRYYLSGTHSAFYSKYAIDSIASIRTMGSKRRCSLNNKVHVFLGNDTLTIVGCHFSSSNHHIKKGYQNREKEADAIYESMKDKQYPTIVMGDLNDISGSYAVERIKEAGLKDAWWKGGVGYGSTFHEGWLRLRLDHILYQDNKLDLQYVKVIDSSLSDHYAIVAGFTMKK